MYFPPELPPIFAIGVGGSPTIFMINGDGMSTVGGALTGGFVGIAVNVGGGEGVYVGFAINATDQEAALLVGEGELMSALATVGVNVKAPQTVNISMRPPIRNANKYPVVFPLCFAEELVVMNFSDSTTKIVCPKL